LVSERRKLQRNRVYLGASIALGDGRSTLDCIVRNLTAEGAMLATPNAAVVPELVDLAIPQKGQSFRARTIWRAVERFGIAFLDRELEAAPVSLDLARRLKNCEAEREALRSRVAELSEAG
jgi:hypothetical protein